MSKRSRPQPISAPAPESFLPTFDFGFSPKAKSSSSPLPPRKPVASLSKRLAAFTFLNLEDIVEESDDHTHKTTTSPVADRISPPPSTTSTKSARFWEFNRSKHHTPTTPMSLPPMSSKAYATLVGGSATPGLKPLFSPPPSKVIRHASPTSPVRKSTLLAASVVPFNTIPEEEQPKSLAIDLVSIFSLSTSDDAADSSSYRKTRFSFPMPPSALPRRGSQSPLDPEMSFPSYNGSTSPVSLSSPSSDYSFFSPLFTPGLTYQSDAPRSPEEYLSPISPISPLRVDEEKPTKKRRSIRPLTSLPPAAPPPRDSPPPTPTSPAFSTYSADQRAAAASAGMRACPSPDLDPELSTQSNTSSLVSVLLGADSSMSSAEKSEAEETDVEDAISVLGPMHSLPQRKQSAVDPIDWANWAIGAPSRSGSIVTLTQRNYNSATRGSLSAGGPPGRNGSIGHGDMYGGDWDQAIDDLFSFSSMSRKPSLSSIAYAASAEGAALASTSMNVVEDTAFVMDDHMMQKFMESQFLVPTRHAPTPPKQPHATLTDASNSSISLSQTTSSATPSASATSSARSSLDEERSTHSHHAPLTPVHETEEHDDSFVIHGLPVVAPLALGKGIKPRPTPLVASQSYPPANLSRPPRPARPNRNAVMLTAAPAAELPQVSPLDLTHRPPPTQSVPSESSLFSPSLSGLSLSPQSPRGPFPIVDVDSWPTWSSIDVAFERKRDHRRPSAGAVTMMSKFSDDSFDVRPKKRRDGAPKTIKKTAARSPAAATTTAAAAVAQNMNPGSSHTSYTFLGMKKRKDTSPTSSTTPPSAFARQSPSPPRVSMESAHSRTSTETTTRREGLKRPPLPLELFIRA